MVGLGVVGWPIAATIFPRWENRGYLMAKIIGVGLVAWLIWIWGSLGIPSFSTGMIAVSAAMVWVAGWLWLRSAGKPIFPIDWKKTIGEELFFLGLLLAWSWVKAHEPTINGLEKFMDFGFAKSILRSATFPPADMWYAGESINYYYFGHLIMAFLSKLSGVDLVYGFNLMLATLFAWCGTMSFAIGRQLLTGLRPTTKIGGALLTAFLVTLGGNLHPIYAFTSGYTGEEPPPWWQNMTLTSGWDKLKDGWGNYWYPNATRFIPYTIHEFPSYSFVVSDIHGHVLSIPLALLLIGLTVQIFCAENRSRLETYGVYGLTAGLAFMTNALDGPIYLGLLGLVTLVKTDREQFGTREWWLSKAVRMGLAISVFMVTIMPFLMSFKPFVTGLAVNCPPAWMANSQKGPLIFEGVEKCQRSPLWMLLVLWGFFLYTGIKLVTQRDGRTYPSPTGLLLLWGAVSVGLVLFSEFFYFKDIYPLHFRSNTMFKLGYQAFMMMAIMAGYSITMALRSWRKNLLFIGGLLPLLFLVSVYPVFAVKSYFNGLKQYEGLYGLEWLERRYPGDVAAIQWLNENVKGQPIILEANGDSYTDYERISTFTGLPTVAGWIVHEWLWRGGYEHIAARAEEVRQIYEYGSLDEAKRILSKYNVAYVIVGNLERDKYENLDELKFLQLGRKVFEGDGTAIYSLVK